MASVRWLAHPSQGDDIAPKSGEAPLAADAASSTWSGAVALDTKIEAWITPLGSSTELPSIELNLVVDARPWPQLGLPGNGPYVHRYTYDPRHKMKEIPQQGVNFVLGAFGIADLNFRDVPTTTLSTGPNRGFVFYAVPPAVPTPEIWTHPGLRSGPWYDDQNGGVDPSTHRARCTQSIMPTLELLVESHEGVTKAEHSHWGVADGLFQFSRLTGVWEAMVEVTGSATELHRSAQGKYDAFYAHVAAAQDDLDGQDYPVIFGSLGCQLDMDPSHGDN